MQGLILAAGMGKRLKELTADNTKCMVKVNGITLIERALQILDKKNLSKIIIVIGYQGEKLRQFVDGLNINTKIVYVENPVYYKTNNIYSLSLAKDYMCSEDTILLESDLVFEEAVIDALIDDKRETLTLVDKYESWMDGTCTILDDNDCIVDFIPGKYLDFSEKSRYYKTVNIYKFSSHFSKYTYIPFLSAYATAMGNNEYYESVIKLIAMLDTKEITAKRLTGQIWYEIDDIQDLDIAESLFEENALKRYKKIAERYGGYWRYPNLIDYCYLVNPFFPSPKMTDEICSNFNELMAQYPSGMRVNSLLAAKNFGVKQSHIVVGNGAAELIKSLMEKFGFNKVGFIRPTFEEYPNRFCNEAIIMNILTDDFRYSVDDIIKFFSEKEIDALVLINPDNPSGNYIERVSLQKLIEWAKDRKIVLVIDESFVDFADLDNSDTLKDLSLIDEEILASYENLYVVKSISKSYGVPGFRLGVIASSNEEKINIIKEDVSIWNINSFAEFFMQIYEKYQKDYEMSLVKIRQERKHIIEELSKIGNIAVFPSQANYIMCRLKDGAITSNQLAQKLLEQYSILIKDLTPKIKNGGQYIRMAIKTGAENNKLLSAISKIMEEGLNE